MQKKKPRTIKILIDSAHLSAQDISDIEQWENEGGMTGYKSDFVKQLAPVKRGEIFEVKGGDIHYENGHLYFEAEVQRLALH